MSRRLTSLTALLAVAALAVTLAPLPASAAMQAPPPTAAAPPIGLEGHAVSPPPAPAPSTRTPAVATRRHVALNLTPTLAPGATVRRAQSSTTTPAVAPGRDTLTVPSGPGADFIGDPGGDLTCTASVDYGFSDIQVDDFLEETVHVDYQAEVDCNFILDGFDVLAGLYDRSPDFNGETFDGDVINVGDEDSGSEDSSAFSSGSMDLEAHTYDGGRMIEPAFEMFLLAPVGVIWADCQPLPGLRYLACDGVGGDELHALVGTGPVSTGMTKTCRDQTAVPADQEQQRLSRTFNGSVPASTDIIRLSSTVLQQVVDFKKNLCSATDANGFASQQGQQLWTAAVRAAQNGEASGDDRPLYWARLTMTVAIDQWRPSFSFDRLGAEQVLDRAARGMSDDTFRTGQRHVLISGFDPFGLDGDIRNDNPSGAIALSLDGRQAPARDGTMVEIQAVVFPVRYDDFDGGLVETVFGRHMNDALLATVSENPNTATNFDLEYYNGDWRGGAGDNRNQTRTAGPVNASGPQFSPTTLPVDAMKAVDPSRININTSVQEIVGGVTQSPTDGPTIGSTARQGGGGSYLSNEIAYRVTTLRDRSNRPSLRAGHVHVPNPGLPGGGVSDGAFTGRLLDIVNRFTTILLAGATASPRLPLQLTTDKTSYKVGEQPAYTVQGPPSQHIKWSSFRNGASTGEVEADYATQGIVLDAAGGWSGSGAAWQSSDAGSWTRYVRVAGRLTSAVFQVGAPSPTPTPTPTPTPIPTPPPPLNWDEVPGHGGTTSGPAAASDASHEYLFVRGTNDGIYSNVLTSSWTGWLEIPGGGSTQDRPSATVYQGSVYVFVRGGSSIYVNRLTGSTWTGWGEVPGGGSTWSAPAAAVLGGSLYLFVRGTDDHIYRNQLTGTTWTGWGEIPGGGSTQDAPTATVYQGSLYVFVRGAGNLVYRNQFDGGGWSGWGEVPGGGATLSAPAATASGSELDLVVRGTNDHVYRNRLDGTTWSGWGEVPLNGITQDAPGAAFFGGQLSVFMRGTDNNIYVNQPTS